MFEKFADLTNDDKFSFQIFEMPPNFHKNVYSLSTSLNFIIIVDNPVKINKVSVFQKILIMQTIKMIILFEDAVNGKVRMISPDIFLSKTMIDLKIGVDLSKVFMKKIKNLHEYPLKIGYIEDSDRFYESDGKFGGFDGEYFNTVLAALNASYKITQKIPKAKEIFLEAYFVSGSIDVNFNPSFQKSYAPTKTLKPLYPNDIIEIRVLVPKSGIVSSLYLFLQPFSITVWFATIFVFMALGWGWYRLNQRYSKKKLTRTEIGFQLTRMQITQGFNLASIIVPLRFKRVFVIGFIFWSFVLSQAYQSVMIANLLEPFSYPEINTIQQLNMSGLDVIAPNFYYKFANSTYPIKLSKLKLSLAKYELALKHKFEPNTAYVMSNTDAYSVLYSEKNIENGRPIMHLMEEVLAYAPQNYLIHKRSPFKEEIDEIMGRIRASGIDQYWKTLAFGRAEIRYKRKLAQATEPTLKIEQIRYAFYVLFIGHSLAIVVFIFELIWARLQRFLNAYICLPIRH
jgi:hypothetical protein